MWVFCLHFIIFQQRSEQRVLEALFATVHPDLDIFSWGQPSGQPLLDYYLLLGVCVAAMPTKCDFYLRSNLKRKFDTILLDTKLTEVGIEPRTSS